MTKLASRYDFIRLVPTTAEVEQAIAEAARPPLRDSATNGERDWVGFLAEIVVARHLKARRVLEPPQCYDFDLVLPDGRTADVKSKRKWADPQMLHDASVDAKRGMGMQQKCSLYVWAFVVCRDKAGSPGYIAKPSSVEQAGVIAVWLLGYMRRDEFLEQATFTPKGTERQGFGVAREDQFDLPLHALHKMADLLLPAFMEPSAPDEPPWLEMYPPMTPEDRCDEPDSEKRGTANGWTGRQDLA